GDSGAALEPLLPGQALADARQGLRLQKRFAAYGPYRAGVPGSFGRRFEIAASAGRQPGIDLAPIFRFLLLQEGHFDDSATLWAGWLVAGQVRSDGDLFVTVETGERDRCRLLDRRLCVGLLSQGGCGKRFEIGRFRLKGGNGKDFLTAWALGSLTGQVVLDVE